jgi:uncharacterized RDD family membrane protein YckC
MSSTEPPGEPTPPPGEPTPPPPAPEAAAPPPPPNPSTVPPPPPPPAGATAPMPGAPAAYGPGSPGNLVDRFLARLIDGIIVGIAYVIIYTVLLGATSYFLAVFVSGVVGAALYLGYFGYMESNRGQTLGKQVMKLKTVGPDGQSNPTMNEAIKRNIWYAFGVVPFVGGLAELASVIFIAIGINGDPVNRQHWFDTFAGGTKVLKVG